MVALMLLLLLPSLNLISAQQTSQEFAKIHMMPIYRESMAGNTGYGYNLTVETPDGIDEIKNAMVTMQVWVSPTVSFDLLVNGTACNNPSFEIHTTYAGAGEGTVFFDCTNVITGEGSYNITITPDDDVGASTFWVDLTYVNDPDGDFEVQGTQYYPGFNATSFLQLIDNNGNFVDNATCEITIWNPSWLNQSKLFDAVPMDFIEFGIYEHNFVTPDVLGVYKVAALCEYETEGQTFNLANSTSFDGSLFDDSTGDRNEAEFSDCVFIKTEAGTFQQFNYLDAGIGNLNTSNMDGILVSWIGQNDKVMSIQLRDFNAAEWDTIGASITASTSSSGDCGNSHGISRFQSANLDDYIGGVGNNEIHVRVLLASGGKILSDEVELRVRNTVSAVNDIRGAGEVVIIPKVWEDAYSPHRNITSFNFTVNATINNTELVEEVWNFSGTISNNILTQFVNSVWAYLGTINNNVLGQMSNYTWFNSTGRYTHGIVIP